MANFGQFCLKNGEKLKFDFGKKLKILMKNHNGGQLEFLKKKFLKILDKNIRRTIRKNFSKNLDKNIGKKIRNFEKKIRKNFSFFGFRGGACPAP